MKVERVNKPKLITTKYELKTRVNPVDFLHDQVEIAQDHLDGLNSFDLDGKLRQLTYLIRPTSAEREVEDKVSSGEFTKEEAVKTLLSKLKSKYRSELKNYKYQPERAIQVFKFVLKNRNDKTYDEYEKLAIEAGLNQYIEKYGEEKTNQDLSRVLSVEREYDYDLKGYASYWRISRPGEFKLLEKKYVRPEDIGRDKYSSVSNSSFSTYYYYKVKVQIFNDVFEDVIQLSHYYSGGWN